MEYPSKPAASASIHGWMDGWRIYVKRWHIDKTQKFLTDKNILISNSHILCQFPFMNPSQLKTWCTSCRLHVMHIVAF